METDILGDLVFLSFVVGLENITNPHNATVLMPSLGTYVKHCHDQLMVEVTKTKLSPNIFLSCVNEMVPSIGLTSNY